MQPVQPEKEENMPSSCPTGPSSVPLRRVCSLGKGEEEAGLGHSTGTLGEICSEEVFELIGVMLCFLITKPDQTLAVVCAFPLTAEPDT